MNFSDHDARDSDSYRVFLLRLWREKDGPWRASLQSADAAATQRFADLDALAEFFRTTLPPSGAHAPEAGESD